MIRSRNGDLDRRRATDDMVVGQHLPRRGEHHSGSGGGSALVADGSVDNDGARANRRGAPARPRDCDARDDSDRREAPHDEAEKSPAERPDTGRAGEKHALRSCTNSLSHFAVPFGGQMRSLAPNVPEGLWNGLSDG